MFTQYLGRKDFSKCQMPETENKTKKTIDTGNKFLKTEISDCQENKRLTKLTRNK